MELDVSSTLIVVLFLAAFCSGFLNAVVGGGGFILFPVMLAVGIAPIYALALNKLQNTAANSTSSYHFYRKGYVDVKGNKWVYVTAMLGAFTGVTMLEAASNSGWLAKLIPYVLIIVACFMAKGLLGKHNKKKTHDSENEATVAPVGVRAFTLSERWRPMINVVFGSVIGVYGGFFGPGTGPVVVSAFSFIRTYNLRQAISNSKVILLITNACSLVFLIYAGYVWWFVGGFMVLGGVLGSFVGARVMLKADVTLLRVLLVLVPLASGLKMLFVDGA